MVKTAHVATQTADPFAGANGKMTLDLGWRGAGFRLVIHGGPFDRAPQKYDDIFTVCVRSERPPQWADYVLPIKDFSVPPAHMTETVRKALLTTFEQSLQGQGVYVGCMGGMGRTGLFLALMAKTAGVDDPVKFVRMNYYGHAVETAEQRAYVEEFDVSELQHEVRLLAWQYGAANVVDAIGSALRTFFTRR